MTLPTIPAARPHRPLRRARGLVAALAAFAACAATAAAPERLRIAVSRAPVSLPMYVAAQRGFFRDEGLDVVIDDCVGGRRCLGRMLDGQADLATSGEMPVVLRSFERPEPVIVATITNASDNLKLVARRASGVALGEQLDGRKVGVIAGTAAQYVLETHLLAVGVDPRHVTMVPMQAEDVAAALRDARVDAAAVWEPFGFQVLHGADAAGVRLPFTAGYIESYNLVARRSQLAAREAALAKVLRAVDRAEDFIHANPAQAQAILMMRLGMDRAFVDWVWSDLGFRLSLDQTLIATMESEARWAQREGHVPAGARLNVLTLVHTAPLKAVKPAAVGTGN